MSNSLQALHCPMAMTIPTNSACSVLIGQTSKLFYIVVVIVIISSLDSQICSAQLTMCKHNVNYTQGGKFESNLNRVLNTLVRDTYQTGFNTSEYGRSPDQVYGLLQCRGDATAGLCYNCSQRARSAIQQSCGNAVGGRIWLDVCFLRYENYSFFGKLDTDGFYTYITTTVSNPEVFNAALNRLFNKLLAEAESGSGYASGKTVDSLFRKIYALVECWKDISTDDCNTCLSNTINYIFAVFGGTPGAQGLVGSCIVRYEIYPFFNSTALPPSTAEAQTTTVAVNIGGL